MKYQAIRSTIKGLGIPALIVLMLIGTHSMATAKNKILFIDSYHEGYEWSDGVTQGIQSILKDTAELKIYRMDTKNNPSPEFAQKAAEEARRLIDQWQPDVVIAADDNASKYIIKPFYVGKDLPVVFCGVNWDSSLYGFPTKNICGMEEVSLVEPLLQQMKNYAKGDRIGYLAVDDETARKEATYIKKVFGVVFAQEIYTKTYAEWKEKFKMLQSSVDMLIIDNNAGIKDWSADDAAQFVRAESRIPSGCVYVWMMPYAVIGYTKLPEEQGEWSAAAALRILNGESPEKIGVVRNKKGKLYVNLPLATSMGIKIPLNILKSAEVIKN
ncbi:MAG: ABC transporter substrate binding protein [Pseudomonadota bacterium]